MPSKIYTLANMNGGVESVTAYHKVLRYEKQVKVTARDRNHEKTNEGLGMGL